MLGLWFLFVLSLPLADLLLFPSVLVGAGQPSTFFAVLLFAALVLTQPRTSFRILSHDRHSRLLLALLAVAAASVFMSAAAPLQEWKSEFLWIKSLKQCLQLAICFCCFALPLLYLNTPARYWQAVRLYAFTLAAVAVYGVLEMLHYRGIDTGVYPVLADALHAGSFFGSADAPNLVFLPSLRGFPRLRLLASEPSMAGNYLLSVLPLGFLVAVRRRRWHWWTVACAGLAALFLTFSLGSWIAAGVSVTVGLAVLLRDRRRAPKLAALAVVAAGLLLGGSAWLDRAPSVLAVPREVLSRLTRPEGDISVSGRLLENRTAWEIFADYPLLGVGIGNWVFHYPGRMSNIPNTYVHFRQQVTEGTGFQRSAGINNLFLRLLCETGVIGFGVFVLFLWSLWRTIARLLQISPVVRPLALALAMACGALVFHFNSLSAFDKRYWWFLFGLVAAAGRLFLTRPRYAVVLEPGSPALSRQDRAEVTP